MTTLSLLHPTDVLAIEVREALERRPELWHTLRLLSDDDEEIGVLADVRGTATLVGRLEEEALADTDLALVFGSRDATTRALALLPPGTRSVIVESSLDEVARSADEGPVVVAGVNLEDALASDGASTHWISPHPAVVGLAQVLAPLRDFGLRGVYGTVHLPGSGYGRAGLDELFAQARDLLSFQPLRTEVLPAQLAFNLLAPGPGVATLVPTLREILGFGRGPLALQTLEGGIFHGIGLSLIVDLADAPSPEAVRERLGESPWLDLAVDPELLGTIDAANRDEVLIGSVDARGDSLFGLWAVLDNLTRGGALNALAVVEALVGPADA